MTWSLIVKLDMSQEMARCLGELYTPLSRRLYHYYVTSEYINVTREITSVTREITSYAMPSHFHCKRERPVCSEMWTVFELFLHLRETET